MQDVKSMEYKVKKKKNSLFVKHNKCPYCTYNCDSAFMNPIDPDYKESNKPVPGNVSFCLMCGEPSRWDHDMKLIKFDLNTIPDILERNRIKLLGMHIHTFWEQNPCKDGRREKYLKIMDKKSK